jgi:type II secretory pathway pseudopilin PulG
MNRGKGQVKTHVGGYTIVETLIFLAVSAAMFIAAMAFVSGQQNRAQFVNAVHDFEQQLTDISNNVSTGYYEYPSGLTCNVDASNTPQPGAAGSGKCILVGVAIKLGEGGDDESYSTVTLVGSKVNSAGIDVHNLEEARPVPVSTSVSTKKLLSGAKVGCIERDSSGCVSTNAAIGFFTKLTGSVTEDTGKNNIIRTDLLPYFTVNLGDDMSGTLSKISANTAGVDYRTAGVLANPANMNPQSLTICLIGDATNQHAQIKISGATTGSLSITTDISGGTACS